MEIDPEDVVLGFYQHGNSGFPGSGQVRFEDGFSLGEYHHRDPLSGKYRVQLNLESLRDLNRALSTIAHELAHAKLIGEYRIRGDEEAHEYLTDLAVIYFGFGIFQANSSFERKAWTHGDGMSGWSMGRSGYLPLEMTAYGLAWHAFLRGERKPEWTGDMKREGRRITERALAYLWERKG